MSKTHLNEPLLSGGQGEGALTPAAFDVIFDNDALKDEGKTPGMTKSLENFIKLGRYQGLERGLRTSLQFGIKGTPDDLAWRREQFGSNKKKIPEIKTLWSLILENFDDRILQILCVAAVVSTAMGIIQDGWEHGWYEGVTILLAICIIVSVTAGNNYMKELQFRQLVSKQGEQRVTVIRGGDHTEKIDIDSEELVVGDLLVINQGIEVPADCICTQSLKIVADESSVTGESDPMHKDQITAENENQPKISAFLIGKTLINEGAGRAVVCGVGVNSMSGKAESKLNIEDEATPLQTKLEQIANDIGKLGVAVAVLTFTFLVGRLVYDSLKDDTTFWSSDNISAMINAFITSITVVVVAVPEGLPLAVTISLAFSVMQMKKENNLVKKLHASETMGGGTQICTDKTGTLTQNIMKVRTLFLNDIFHEAQKNGSDVNKLQETETFTLIQQACLFNCSAYIDKEKGVTGNATEQGIIKFFLEQGVNCQHYFDLKAEEGYIVDQVPFDSAIKRQITVIKNEHKPNTVRILCKGAPDFCMRSCSKIMVNGRVSEIDNNRRDALLTSECVSKLAKRAFRTILVAYKDMNLSDYNAQKASRNIQSTSDLLRFLESDLTFLGIFGIQDPLRGDVPASIKTLTESSGITVRMCTGDNIETATAISLEAGIVKAENVQKKYTCMTGKDFRDAVGGLVTTQTEDGFTKDKIKNSHEFKKIAANLRVLARSSPQDKYILVTGLQEMGEVVAVTGDGTNDAPALKKADVGFAMGITGTKVAQEACDIVLMDDNFKSVMTAVKFGRNIFNNVRKFLQFQLTVNVVAMFTVFIGSAITNITPLSAVQLLWVNMIMDTFAALALATEPPNDELLLRKPYHRDDSIISSHMWRNIISWAVCQIIILSVLIFDIELLWPDIQTNGYETMYYSDLDPVAPEGVTEEEYLDGLALSYQYTLVFQVFVFMQVFNSINARKLENELNVFAGFFNNPLFIVITLLTIVVQMVLVEFGGSPVSCVKLTTNDNIKCLSLSASMLVVGVLVKFIPDSIFERFSPQKKHETVEDDEASKLFINSFKSSFRDKLSKDNDDFKKMVQKQKNEQLIKQLTKHDEHH